MVPAAVLCAEPQTCSLQRHDFIHEIVRNATVCPPEPQIIGCDLIHEICRVAMCLETIIYIKI